MKKTDNHARTSQPKIKKYKTSELYVSLYGRGAYETWKAREAEINQLMRDRRGYSVDDICCLRRENFHRMESAAGTLVAQAEVAPETTPADLSVAA